MGSFLKDFRDLFFPNTCVSCHASLVEHEDFFCTFCWQALPMETRFGESNSEIEKRLSGRVPLFVGFSLFRYERKSTLRKVLKQIKYKGGIELAEFLGCQIAICRKAEFLKLQSATLVPVPLHKKKLRARGFNQSLEIARGICAGSGLPLENIMVRLKNTQTQTRKSKVERWKNVEQAFSVYPGSKVKGRHFILVDDVFTTGSTIESCAETLIKNGAKNLSVVTLATAAL